MNTNEQLVQLINATTTALRMKREAVSRELRTAVAKHVHVKQYEQAEEDLSGAIEVVINRQVKKIANGLKKLNIGEKAKKPTPTDTAQALVSQVYDRKKAKEELVNAILPILAIKMAEASVASMIQLGVNPRSKGVRVLVEKHLLGTHNQQSHGHPGPGNYYADVDTSNWGHKTLGPLAKKKINALTTKANSGDWYFVQSVKKKLEGQGKLHKYDQAVLDSCNQLLAQKEKANVKQAPPVGLTTEGKSGLVSANGWTQTGPKLGTQPGGKFKAEDGKEYYAKFPKDPDVARNEVLANKLYEAAGAGVPKAYLIEKDGNVGIATEWQEGSKKANYKTESDKNAACEDFAVHAWTANWDCVGAGSENPMDNIRMVDGKAMSVDVGGALSYSGTGSLKPKLSFGNKAIEWDGLRDSEVNPSAAKVFGKMTKEQLVASANKLKLVSDDAIDSVVKKYGDGSVELATKLKQRRDDIIAKADALDKVSTKQTVVTTPTGGTAVVKQVPTTVPMPVLKGKTPIAMSAKQKLAEMQELAAQGKWSELEAIKTKADSNSWLPKKIHDYKMALLNTKPDGNGNACAVMSKDTPASIPKSKINVNILPPTPKFASTNKAQVAVNEKAAAKMLEYAKNGDMYALKTMTVPASPKLKAFHEELMINLAEQVNPPPPAKKITGSLAEISAKAKVVVGGKSESTVGKYLLLGDASPVPTDAKIKGKWNAGKGSDWAKGQVAYNKLTQKERSALKSYTGSGFVKINDELRGFKKLSLKTKEAVAGLHKAAIPIPEGTSLGRKHGMSYSDIIKMGKLEGAVIQDRGIISTSSYKGTWHGDVKLELVAGPGVRALPAKNFSSHPSENEYLLPANTRYLITHVESTKNGLEVQATILPYETTQCCPP